jgi:hypothetical protein
MRECVRACVRWRKTFVCALAKRVCVSVCVCVLVGGCVSFCVYTHCERHVWRDWGIAHKHFDVYIQHPGPTARESE